MSVLKKNKSGIFLIELMFVVLIILLSVTSCVKIFFESQKLSEKSYVLTHAVIESENAAKLLKNGEGSATQLQDYYKLDTLVDNEAVYFDDAFEVCTDKEKQKYKMSVEKNSEGLGLVFFEIVFSDIKSEDIIYTLKMTSISKNEVHYE